MNKKITEILAATFLLGLFAAPAVLVTNMSCKIDDGGDEEGDGGTGEDPTCDCPSPEAFASCVCDGGPEESKRCWTQSSCESWCFQQNNSHDAHLVTMSCFDEPDQGSCTGWNPSSAVTLSGGVRYIDDVWLASLVSQPAPLWTCDNVIFNDVNGGGFKVEQANTGEFFYQLGLRNNDIPLTINTKPLGTVYEAMDAFESLYNGGTTSYTLVVKRGAVNITLFYQIN